ncbi:MAG: DinB family protein [Dehalococcoidia bacterium]|nr:DinB family protein [Dehalococcoidia bacterium]
MERSDLIRRYAEGPAVLRAAVERIGEERLDLAPADGSWTARQVVHHVADSEMTSALRLRRLLAEEDVVIVGYPEDVWAKRLYYHGRPVANSLAAIDAARATTLEILERMREDEWQRAGSHNELGSYTPGVWLEIYARHCHEHAEQLVRAAAM